MTLSPLCVFNNDSYLFLITSYRWKTQAWLSTVKRRGCKNRHGLVCASDKFIFSHFSILKILFPCVSGSLTSADPCPSRFKWPILTLRMAAPANCTSVCPLTQRPARLLSKVRSGSDYNPFPSWLSVSCATSWQQLFQLISLEIATSRPRQKGGGGHLRGDPASISNALFDWVL